MLGYALTNLAGVLTERGDLDEALDVAREGLPLVREDGSVWIFADHVALRAALIGKLSDAACLAGYSDYTWTAKKATRQPNEARAHERLQSLLNQKLASEELLRLRTKGASMSEDQACQMALQE